LVVVVVVGAAVVVGTSVVVGGSSAGRVGDAGLLGCPVVGAVRWPSASLAHAAAITSTPSEATSQIGFGMMVVLSA
jgi:hypothetical protein